MDVVEASATVALPAVRAVFREGEVTAMSLSATDELGGSIALCLTANGEEFRDLIVQGHVPHLTADDWAERLRSNLVDFVAEGRRTWGENRDRR